MNCEQGLLLLNARIDGELSPDDGHRLSAHLCECVSCQSAAEELERTDRALARVLGAQARVASSIADQALQKWMTEAPTPARGVRHLWWISAAAAGFALALFVDRTNTEIPPTGGYHDERVTALLDEWKQSDTPQEIELQIRSIGSSCASPLADALEAWDPEADDERRIEVARVLCDLAGTAQIPTLINLLGDSSGEIRERSEASLVRITGRHRIDPTVTVPLASCSNPEADWRDWWHENRHRFEVRELGPVYEGPN